MFIVFPGLAVLYHNLCQCKPLDLLPSTGEKLLELCVYLYCILSIYCQLDIYNECHMHGATRNICLPVESISIIARTSSG